MFGGPQSSITGYVLNSLYKRFSLSERSIDENRNDNPMNELNDLKRSGSLRRFLAGSVLIAMVLFVVFGIVLLRPKIDELPFASETWVAWDPNDVPRRDAKAFTIPQRMINDLVSNHLVGKNRQQIEAILGESPTWSEERRHSTFNNVLSSDGTYYVRNGEGHYGDEYEWDLIYDIGAYYPPEGLESFGVDSDMVDEQLVIRLDANGRFESWYVIGSPEWPSRLSKEAAKWFRQTRRDQ
ncbi:hypothetical protein CA54_12950 [Symmachiella macrocystis]|uniref:Uncharacterized protein n=2 Tax=Symmachiella macrocystis TaxID=2527985 RepID=A0A5C6BLZ2_9PLAN|nr:hypothetical protein CA54_12950 [Symmachiella macrocystis]